MKTFWRVNILIGFITLICGLLIINSYRQATTISAMNTPLLTMVNEIRMEVKSAEMWIEEALDGETLYDPEVAWGHVELHLNRFAALFENPLAELKAIPADRIADAKQKIREVRQEIDALKTLVQSWTDRPAAQPLEHQDPEIKERFRTISTHLAGLDHWLEHTLIGGHTRLRNTYLLILLVFLLLLITLMLVLRMYERRRLNDFTTLAGFTARLQEEVTQRRATEQELIAARVELEKKVEERTAELQEINQRLAAEIRECETYEQELVDHQNRLRELSFQLTNNEELFRRSIALEIHDRIGQNLAVAKIRLGSLVYELQAQGIGGQVDKIQHLVDQTIEDSRSLTFEISPPVLYELGLEAALEWLVEMNLKKHDQLVHLEMEGEENGLSTEHKVFLFRAAHELVFNALKHARSDSITVSLHMGPQETTLTVRDNGVGMDMDRLNHKSSRHMGLGLFSIRERVQCFGGTLQVASQPDAGTQVGLTLPRTAPAEKEAVNGCEN